MSELRVDQAELEQTIKVLKVELECVSRDCDRDCAKCDLVLETDEVKAAYNSAIKILEWIASGNTDNNGGKQ